MKKFLIWITTIAACLMSETHHWVISGLFLLFQLITLFCYVVEEREKFPELKPCKHYYDLEHKDPKLTEGDMTAYIGHSKIISGIE